MKNVMLVMQGSDLQKLESFIEEMPFKFAQPLLQELGKHVKEIEEQPSVEEVKEPKIKK